ncbi:pirin family protein [Burkholderia cepacia]|nr:pirin family protein [Burkholderia cepacia]
MLGGAMDPVVMLDHFEMTAPTFEPHPHAGISAVTYVFEDAMGAHVNYDSLGNHGPIEPGALHWFAAGRGAVHTEQPEGIGHRVHALQIFVNLPAAKKYDAPYAVHVEPHEIPEFTAPGVRVRVVSGSSNGVNASVTPKLPEPFTLLDAFVSRTASFGHELPRGWNATIHIVSGAVRVEAAGMTSGVKQGEAVSVTFDREASADSVRIRIVADEDAHFVVLSGAALQQPIARHGPFVMNTHAQLDDRISAYRSGAFGQLRGPVGAP